MTAGIYQNKFKYFTECSRCKKPVHRRARSLDCQEYVCVDCAAVRVFPMAAFGTTKTGNVSGNMRRCFFHPDRETCCWTAHAHFRNKVVSLGWCSQCSGYSAWESGVARPHPNCRECFGDIECPELRTKAVNGTGGTLKIINIEEPPAKP